MRLARARLSPRPSRPNGVHAHNAHVCARVLIILTSGRRYLARAITASPSPPSYRLPKRVVCNSNNIVLLLNRFVIIIIIIGDVYNN